MIRAEVGYKNDKKGVILTITGTEEEIFNEFRAIFKKVSDDDKLTNIVEDAIDSLASDEIIKI